MSSPRKSVRLINREISWLDFNTRVLEEAGDESVPLLERLKFIAITGNNLDEFFMVRMGSLHLLLSENTLKKDAGGLTPGKQLEQATAKARTLVEAQTRCFREEIEPRLQLEGIVRITPESANAEQRRQLADYFHEELASVLTPAAVDLSGPKPQYANLKLHLLIRLKSAPPPPGKRPRPRLAILPLMGQIDRFISLRVEQGYGYMLVEDVIAMHIQEFFPNDDVLEVLPFRITRNADMAVSEDGALDLVTEMSAILHERKISACVRIEFPASATRVAEQQLARIFHTGPEALYRVNGPLDLSAYFALAGLPGYDHLREPDWKPVLPPDLDLAKPLFDQIAAKPRLLHHPYETFDPVVTLIDQAADDPQVIAIKQILYRTSRKSPIVAALMRAAGHGKTVTVIVELKARFDEARNIEWARAMEEAGVQVIYGVKGFKTHAKLLIIVRREPDGIRRYMHFGTGNYNEGTAKLYTDVSYFTCDPDLGADAGLFFNTITGFSQPQTFRRIAAAPLTIRETLYQNIESEIERARQGEPARIIAKLNSLTDPGIIRALYNASNAGVIIDLIIRGICCLLPGVKGMSENIRVISIIDRFLEHSRIIWFRHGGDPRVFISSADWMTRNLDKRVELMTPVDDPTLCETLESILHTALRDTRKARELRKDGHYHRLRALPGEEALRSQEILYQQAASGTRGAARAKRTTFEPHRPRKRKKR
ncbi:MAG: polyphosphate kinase 1 [Verrucomicrobia bacterium]|nr:polyphosphate kinase 1 [Verrucomicrobiota bacterium]MCH8525588.1 polyphosphate kinase 1 [Kiritimatiellia bacterium]